MFGYALLEETRPKIGYWDFIFQYTIVLLSIKFVINLSVLGKILNNPTFLLVNAYMKIGIYDHSNSWATIVYMLPEIIILALCILNNIKLKLIGLYYRVEDDVETIEEGIQRNIVDGDEEAVKEMKQ